MSGRAAGPSRLGVLLRIFLICVPCFVLGAGLGLLWQDPELVGSYLLGRTEEVALGPGFDGLPDEAGELPAVAAPPQAEQPAPAAPRAARPGGSVVQVGAFGERASAERLAGALREKGYPVRVRGGDSAGGWRVRVGPYATPREAEAAAGRLKSQERLPTWVLEEDG